MADSLTDRDAALLRRSVARAGDARARGDRPFAAVIATEDGTILVEAGSTQGAGGGGTLAHAEMNACNAAIRAGITRDILARATIYSSGEPCAMCSAAIFYTGIGRVVYGLSNAAVLHLRNAQPHTAGLSLSCREVLSTAHAPPEVIGPCLESEAAAPHEGYWVTGAA